ncbi:hypothetical protein NC651_029455 [Populus alba x Populus x berolinensis]|nr:hypothetical protein NC651_029455 [Populus alba x Populus x berolinensis]
MIQHALLLISSHLTFLSCLQYRGKKHNMFSLLFGNKALSSVSKSTKKLSAVGVVEELFEEGSAILAERLSVNSGSFFSTGSKPWEGPFLCSNCQKKKDAMEGKRFEQTHSDDIAIYLETE